ncbi:MAG: hypothetical protein QOG43_150 [Actinomycetota bacterium]|nr:hypothetical protein [Actinomycetota bacterium]
MSDEEFDPVPAVGDGADVFDQPALFFLTHQATIEQWAKLSTAAAEAGHQWLSTTVRAALADLAAQRGLELSAVAGPGQWQHLLLHPAETPTVGDEPVIGVGLCWHRQRLDPQNYLPFIGVRVGSNPQGAAAGTAFLDGGGLQLRNEFHWRGKGEPTWPAYFHLDPFERWWQDLDAYRAVIVDQVGLGLDRMEGPVRNALTTLGF